MQNPTFSSFKLTDEACTEGRHRKTTSCDFNDFALSDLRLESIEESRECYRKNRNNSRSSNIFKVAERYSCQNRTETLWTTNNPIKRTKMKRDNMFTTLDWKSSNTEVLLKRQESKAIDIFGKNKQEPVKTLKAKRAKEQLTPKQRRVKELYSSVRTTSQPRNLEMQIVNDEVMDEASVKRMFNRKGLKAK